MKTREQKIMQALKLYQKLFKMETTTERYKTLKYNLFGYLIDNANNPNFLIIGDGDPGSMSVEELYDGLMKQDIIYL